jgi:hypothetical protein
MAVDLETRWKPLAATRRKNRANTDNEAMRKSRTATRFGG